MAQLASDYDIHGYQIQTTLSLRAYSDINPVNENYVVLELATSFNLKDSDDTYQFKKSDFFRCRVEKN